MLNNSSSNFINSNKTHTNKSKFDPNSWIAYDLEWKVIKLYKTTNYNLDKIASGGSKGPILKEYGEIVTFGFEDNHGNKGCFDTSEFASAKSFLEAIKEKILQYKYCFAWGSKAVARKNNKTGELEGINGDLVVLDSNFRANGVSSIVKYDDFSGIPFIKNDNYVINQKFVSDIDMLKVFAKPLVRVNFFKNKYKSLHLDEVSNSLLGYGKLDHKTGTILEEMSIDERKSYCLHDAHLVAELVRINSSDILRIMQVISQHTGLKFEEVCHKGMSGIWKKILNDEIRKRINLVGYSNLSSALRKLYSNKPSYTEDIDIYYNEEEDDEDGEDELSEYKENSYGHYMELKEQKLRESTYNESIGHGSNNNHLNSKGKSNNVTKQDSKREFKGGKVLEPKRGLHYDV